MSQHLKLIKRSTCRCNRISVISAFSLYQIFIETLRFCLAHTNTKTEKKNASLTLQTDQLISTSICNARTVALMAVIQNSRTTIGWQQKDLNPSHRAASELDSTVHQKYMTCVFLTGFPCVARIYDQKFGWAGKHCIIYISFFFSQDLWELETFAFTLIGRMSDFTMLCRKKTSRKWLM